MSRSLENAAWRAAREAKGDGELFWDNAKPKIPLPTLKTIILEAFISGFEWKKHVRPALRFAIKEAHAAACLSTIRNPGAFATAIFREKIASMNPDLDHLDQVLEERRSKPAPEKPERQRTPRTESPTAQVEAAPLPSPDPAKLRKQAESRAIARLTAYVDANKAGLECLPPDAVKDALRAKLREFTEEELLK
jgi:hypothetical protein